MSRFSAFAVSLWSFTAAAAPAALTQPNTFEPNRGQTSPQVKFIARVNSHPVFLTDGAVVVGSPSGPLQIAMLDSNPVVSVSPSEPVPGVTNYLIGRDETKWTLGLPHYGKVRYQQIYRGVDLVYYFNGQELEHDFALAPGADWRQIRFSVNGAKSLRLDTNGDLLIDSPAGILRQRKPMVYQGSDRKKNFVNGRYVIRGDHEFSFEIGKYDGSKALVIDPVTVFSTYVSGNGSDQPYSIAADTQGNSYIAGSTTSTDFPSRSAAQSRYGGMRDAFVTKLDGATGAIVYSTYIGGSDKELANLIKVDASGNAYIIGSTHSMDFPVTNRAFQNTLKGQYAAFVAKLNPAGNGLVYATYLGGSTGTIARGFDLDPQGNVYIAGATNSGDFPVKGTGFGSFKSAGIDGFITKLNPDGSQIVYSGFLGGKGTDVLEAVAVNSFGEATAVGWTSSPDLPTSPFGSRWPTLAGTVNGVMAKVSANGFTLEYISYYGGSNADITNSIAQDPKDPYTVYIGGVTSSPDFPTALGDPVDVSDGQAVPFVAKFALPGAAGPGTAAFKPRNANQVDDYDWIKLMKDPCPAPIPLDYTTAIKITVKNIQDLNTLEEVLLPLLASAAFGLTTVAATVAGFVVTIIIVVKHIMEPVCPSSGGSFPLARTIRSVTVVTGFIYALNSADGNLIEIPQPPLGSGGQTTIRAVTTDPAGSLHMLLQTSDATLPVTASGSKLASGLQGGYVMKLASGNASGPSISGVTNAFGGSTTIAPNSWVAIKGFNLAPAGSGRIWQDPDFKNNQMPTQLDGVSVNMAGLSAYVYYISPTQLNVLTPPNLPSGAIKVTVTTGGATSAAFTAQAAQISPSLFVFGAGPYVIGTHTDGTDLGPTTLYPGLTTPAKPGEVVVLYGNSFGTTSTAVIAGSVTQSGSLPSFPIFKIGGVDAPLQFAGLVAPGLYQFNVQVPASLPDGDNPITAQYNGLTTQSGVVLTIQH
ncbi:MAG TPA: SBBP repeat-containing protein [Bryobacteraceae bacterium]|nr:SBBP repeat-containing protein [Bryobacteraceae bacterium]